MIGAVVGGIAGSRFAFHKLTFLSVFALSLSCGFAAEPAAQAVIAVDLTKELGPIRDMNSVFRRPNRF